MKLSKFLLSCSTIFFSLIVLTGCPYRSNVPITENGIDIPKDFIGKWIDVSELSKERNADCFQLEALNKKEFLLKEFNYTDDKCDTSFYKGRFSLINNVYFMTTSRYTPPSKKTSDDQTDPYDEDKNVYFTYRIRFENGFYRIDELSQDIIDKFNTSKEFEAFVQKNMNNELFYSSVYYNYHKSAFTLTKITK